jgi:two-component system chemotaxis response regulator CheB
MPARDLIVVGTSAGGVQALCEIFQRLPTGLPASIFVVCHLPAGMRSMLPDVLSRCGTLLATHARDGEPFYPGHIYIAPPDRHLLLARGGRMGLSREARENHNRPAVDPLFRSAARHYGARVVGVVLTGALHDGTAGLLAIRRAGGLAVVQDPEEAAVAAMPFNAAVVAGADYIAPIHEIAPVLIRLVREPNGVASGNSALDLIERMPEIVKEDMKEQAADERRGDVSVMTCPECGGALWQVDEARPLRFRCHVGHAYNGEVLLAEQSEALEAALWTAVRIFREKSVLSGQLANRERADGNNAVAARFDEQALQAARYRSVIEDQLLGGARVDSVDPGSSVST